MKFKIHHYGRTVVKEIAMKVNQIKAARQKSLSLGLRL